MRGAVLDCGERVPGYKVSSPNFSGLLAGKSFIIQTDHRSLEWLDWVKENNAHLTKWSLYLFSHISGHAYCNSLHVEAI